MDGSWAQQTVYEIILFLFRKLTGELSDNLWQWFSRFFSAPIAVLDNPLVLSLTKVAIGIALGALSVLVAWSVVRETMARLDGVGIIPPEMLVRRTITAGMAITGTSLVSWFMVTLAEQTRGVLAGVGLDIDLFRQFLILPTEPVATLLLLTLTFVIGAIVLTVQRAIIAAEFTLLLIIGPLMALGLMRDNGQTSWGVWLKELSSLLVTPLIQMLLMLIFLRNWANAAGILSIGDRLASLGFLYVMFRTPTWARQMAYSSGIGGGTAGFAAEAGRLAMMRFLIRRTFKV